MEYTKGPWVIRKLHDTWRVENTILPPSYHKTIASIPTCEGDAKLIAKSPNMIELIRDMLADWQQEGRISVVNEKEAESLLEEFDV